MIAVTGATGTVGSALVRELEAMGAPARVFVRDAAAFGRPGRVEVVEGSFEDPAALRALVAGAQRLFLLSPPGTRGMVDQQVAVVRAAREAGVRHVVKVSSIGADEDAIGAGIIRAHREIERAIEASGMAFTHLRPHWFFQNELGQADGIAASGVFYAPDVARISAIDARDIAAVAAVVLAEGDVHAGRSYVLTGPQALGYADVAGVLTRELGRPVRWVEVGLDDARRSMLDAGLGELAEGFTEIMARYREGGVTAEVSGAVEQLLGRAPLSFAEFVRDHRDAFARVAAAA